jgi:hypothetical protein
MMNLSHLLVEAIRADRESEIATRLLASSLASAQTQSAHRISRRAKMLRRLVLAV